ncbi:hypothetical protein [Nocardia miyunensis]|uniref:hypothetical protein n=1 Tax=Nocardia miyunensis TaxID=282684 RepID=UPI0012F4E3DD|nr:hypothetical protein [Nocardia miyunensis]
MSNALFSSGHHARPQTGRLPPWLPHNMVQVSESSLDGARFSVTAYAVVNSGEIPAIRIRNRIRIPSSWLRNALQLPIDPRRETT